LKEFRSPLAGGPAKAYIAMDRLRSAAGNNFPGALRISRELSLSGPVGPDTRRPPTKVGSRDAAFHRLSWSVSISQERRLKRAALTANPPDLKKQIRAETLARRDAIAPDMRIEKSLVMAEHGAAIDVAPGTVVSGFWPIRSEADIRPLMFSMREKGARLCLPVVLDRQTIIFRDLVRGAEMVGTGFGTAGPGEDAEVLDPQLLLVPLSAFDSNGNRIGYGAGHYDRAIARLVAKGMTPRLIGIAFACQEVDAVPAEPHDVRLDAILTEDGLRSFTA